MYSKHAKWKPVLNCDLFDRDTMWLICNNFCKREGFYEDICAEFRWFPGTGLYVIIDIINKPQVMQYYSGYKMLSCDRFLSENQGKLVCTFNKYLEEDSYC